jgi:hypothetical protein
MGSGVSFFEEEKALPTTPQKKPYPGLRRGRLIAERPHAKKWKAKPKLTDKEQRFKQTARELGVDEENTEPFDKALKKWSENRMRLPRAEAQDALRSFLKSLRR